MSDLKVTTRDAQHLAEVALLGEQIAAQCGFALDEVQQRGLFAALHERAASLQLEITAYIAQASTAPAERQRLIELIVNHETYFLRNQPQIRALRDVLLPEIASRLPPDQPIRIWSAGCATGEEAYTLAISACEALGAAASRVLVLGTDLSDAALARARAGLYRGRSLQHIDAQRLQRFFTVVGDDYQVSAELQARVRFEQHNLLDPSPPSLGRPHVIVCQNVMIYFADAPRRALLARFHELLPEDGLLLLGFSETLWNVFDGFAVREVAGAFVYQRRAASRPSAPQAELYRRSSGAAPQGPKQRCGPIPTPAPATPPDLLAGARAHADRGDLEAAALVVQRALADDEMSAVGYLLLGTIQLRQGLLEAAATTLDRARYLDSAAPAPSFHLADVYRRTGRRAAAQRECRATLRKLEAFAPDAEIDGVTADWLRAACLAWIDDLHAAEAGL